MHDDGTRALPRPCASVCGGKIVVHGERTYTLKALDPAKVGLNQGQGSSLHTSAHTEGPRPPPRWRWAGAAALTLGNFGLLGVAGQIVCLILFGTVSCFRARPWPHVTHPSGVIHNRRVASLFANVHLTHIIHFSTLLSTMVHNLHLCVLITIPRFPPSKRTIVDKPVDKPREPRVCNGSDCGRIVHRKYRTPHEPHVAADNTESHAPNARKNYPHHPPTYPHPCAPLVHTHPRCPHQTSTACMRAIVNLRALHTPRSSHRNRPETACFQGFPTLRPPVGQPSTTQGASPHRQSADSRPRSAHIVGTTTHKRTCALTRGTHETHEGKTRNNKRREGTGMGNGERRRAHPARHASAAASRNMPREPSICATKAIAHIAHIANSATFPRE